MHKITVSAPVTKSYKIAPGSTSNVISAVASNHTSSGSNNHGGDASSQPQSRSFHDHYRVVNRQQQTFTSSSSSEDLSLVGRGKYAVVKSVVKLDNHHQCTHLLCEDHLSENSAASSPSPEGSSDDSSCSAAGSRLHSAEEEGIHRVLSAQQQQQQQQQQADGGAENSGGSCTPSSFSPSVVLAAKFISRCSEGFNPEEGDTLRRLSHPNIIPVLDVLSYDPPPTSSSSSSAASETKTLVYPQQQHEPRKQQQQQQQEVLIMPLVEGGELFKLASTPDNVLSESRAAHYIFQVLDAVAYLHSLGIVHRDIKLENILVSMPTTAEGGSAAINSHGGGGDSSSISSSGSHGGGGGGILQTPGSSWGTVQLIDFGFAKKLICTTDRSLSNCCGSPNYMSPEMLRASNQQRTSEVFLTSSSSPLRRASSKSADDAATAVPSPAIPSKHGKYGVEVDTWACGVSLYVLLFGQYPFFDERRSQWHKKILEGRWAPPPSWRTAGSESAVGGRNGCSPQAMDLISRLLDPNFTSRLSALEALHHPWFQLHGLHPCDVTSTPASPARVSSSSFTPSFSSPRQQDDSSSRLSKKSTRLLGVGVTAAVCGASSTPPPSAIACSYTSACVQNRRGEAVLGSSPPTAESSAGSAAAAAASSSSSGSGGDGSFSPSCDVGCAAGDGAGGACIDISPLFTPPRNTHRLGAPSPYSATSSAGGGAASNESPF